MVIVEESKHSITKIWGSQKIDKNQTYRLITYTLRVECEGYVALAHTVTGEVVILSDEESKVVEKLPLHYSEIMDSLILNHFLVPVEYEEHKQVANLRLVLRKLSFKASNSINSFTILPTTACNARCYYCFEAGVKTATMTKKIADDVVEFIARRCGDKKKVSLDWFGGEPTVGADRITQICEGLRDKGIDYSSVMTSNGYLFDDKLVDLAVHVWDLKHIQISVDGVENNYNKIKSYVNADVNPYQRVLKNVELLTDGGIHVTVRMNIDMGNYSDFERLIDDLNRIIKNKKLLSVYAFPILGEHAAPDGVILHGDDDWMDKKIVELNDLSRKYGLLEEKNEIPYLKAGGCSANNDSHIVISPRGTLSRCKEAFEGREVIGSVWEGITDCEYFDSWKRIKNYDKCVRCIFFPQCIKLANCNGRDNCIHYDRNHQYEITIKTLLKNIKSRRTEV